MEFQLVDAAAIGALAAYFSARERIQPALLLPVFRQLFRIMLIGPPYPNPRRNSAIARGENAEAKERGNEGVEKHKNEPDKQDTEAPEEKGEQEQDEVPIATLSNPTHAVRRRFLVR